MSGPSLLETLRAGDHRAFARVATEHGPWLRRILYRWTHDGDCAQDGVQEVLLKLWQVRERLVDEGRLENWLYTVARNWAMNRERSMGRRPVTVTLDPGVVDGLGGVGGGGGVGSGGGSAPGPEASLLQRLRRYHVERAVAALSEGQRAVFELGHLEGWPYERVARTLGVPVGTVKSRMYTALRNLREQLVKDSEVLFDEL